MPPTLTTNRLILRTLQADDAQHLFELIRDRAIAATTATIPHPYARHMADEFIAARRAPGAEDSVEAWAITLAGTLLGVISLTYEPELEAAEVGYWIGVPFWGQGFATEACRVVVEHGFQARRLGRIHGMHLVINPGSGVVLGRAGMRQEGIRRRAFRKWERLEDVAYWSILSEEWSAAMA